MTKSMGFAGIWNGFQNEKLEIRRGATPQLFIVQSSVFILPGSALSRAASFTRPKAEFHFKAKTGEPPARTAPSTCQKTFFDTLADCKNVRKTSNSRPSAYDGTVGREL